MQHHDPKQASDDAFEDEPTGKWRVLDAAQDPLLEEEPEDDEDPFVGLTG